MAEGGCITCERGTSIKRLIVRVRYGHAAHIVLGTRLATCSGKHATIYGYIP